MVFDFNEIWLDYWDKTDKFGVASHRFSSSLCGMRALMSACCCVQRAFLHGTRTDLCIHHCFAVAKYLLLFILIWDDSSTDPIDPTDLFHLGLIQSARQHFSNGPKPVPKGAGNLWGIKVELIGQAGLLTTDYRMSVDGCTYIMHISICIHTYYIILHIYICKYIPIYIYTVRTQFVYIYIL